MLHIIRHALHLKSLYDLSVDEAGLEGGGDEFVAVTVGEEAPKGEKLG